MQGKYPEDPTEFEVVASRGDGVGVAKTPFGWFPLKSFVLSDNALTVTFLTQKQVGGTRIKKHRLMDYNNHPDTTLRDIHSLLRTAAGRIESQLRERP
jgi:hypothetical protein